MPYRQARVSTFPILGLALALGGCQVLETIPVDPESHRVEAASEWSVSASQAPIVPAWLYHFDDEKLHGLVADALANNEDLRSTAAKFRIARAEFALQAANEGATVDLNASTARRGTPLGGGLRSTGSSFEARLDAAWEADVWGRLSDLTRAAQLRTEASEADVAAARLSLVANVAQAWFSATNAQLQLDLADSTVRNFEENLAVVEDGFRAGLSSALDVRLERANLAGAQARLQARRVDRERAVRTLEVLLGRYPGGELEVARALPPLAQSVPAGLPSGLLERRPDLAAARLRVEASAERESGAGKARLPQLRLTASGGLSSTELRNLLDFDAILWSLLAGIAAPIVDAGRIEAQVELERARTDDALSAYANAVLQAFLEVENALTAESLLAERERALADAAEQSALAEELALERYRKGLVGIVTWLEARRRAFDARSDLLEVNNQRYQNRVGLFLALGGDFGSADYTSAINQSLSSRREAQGRAAAGGTPAKP